MTAASSGATAIAPLPPRAEVGTRRLTFARVFLPDSDRRGLWNRDESTAEGCFWLSQTFFLSALISHLFTLVSSNTELAKRARVPASAFTCAARRSLAHGVAHVAVADEGALGVLAVAAQADVGVQVTLVHVWKQRERKRHSFKRGEKKRNELPR